MKWIILFRFRNTTPGAIRYQEIDEDGKDLVADHGAKIGALYVRKAAFDNGVGWPANLTVTVEGAD